jgi:hypothetical protein
MIQQVILLVVVLSKGAMVPLVVHIEKSLWAIGVLRDRRDPDPLRLGLRGSPGKILPVVCARSLGAMIPCIPKPYKAAVQRTMWKPSSSKALLSDG